METLIIDINGQTHKVCQVLSAREATVAYAQRPRTIDNVSWDAHYLLEVFAGCQRTTERMHHAQLHFWIQRQDSPLPFKCRNPGTQVAMWHRLGRPTWEIWEKDGSDAENASLGQRGKRKDLGPNTPGLPFRWRYSHTRGLAEWLIWGIGSIFWYWR